MNKKRILITSLVITILLALIGSTWYYLTREDDNTTLTLIEKQWIEKNKNQIYDFGIPTNLPMFSDNGSGVIFDFLNELETKTGLVINKVSYNKTDSNLPEYSLQLKKSLNEKDVLVYKDNYVLVTKNNIKYNSLSEIKNLSIKMLKTEAEEITFYLKDNENLKYTTFGSMDDLINNLSEDNDGIIIPKTEYLDKILNSKNMNIAYNFNDLSVNYAISLGSNEKLNTIITKFFTKWNQEFFEKSFNNNFVSLYFKNSGWEALEEQQFRSKTYKYGFIENAPYDTTINNSLEGINVRLIKTFENISGVTIELNKYNSYEELLNAFNENKIEFYLNATSLDNYNTKTKETASIYDEKLVIVSHNDNDLIIDSANSLKGKKVHVINNAKIANYLQERGVDVILSNNVDTMLNKIDKNSIVALEKLSYNYYKNKKLSNYKIDYEFDLKDSYNFIFRNIDKNNVFIDFYNFYLTFINERVTINNVLFSLTNIKENKSLVGEVIGVSIISLLFIGVIIIVKKIKQSSKFRFKKKLTKDEKLKYIDMLTSLKNRNFLNDNISIWDESEIYPQSIIVIDLNNIAYINDNYGHTEGDEVIKEAANVLIKNQLLSTEIIRTNGNEFLIYLVGYEEKQVVAYIKKLNRELKTLSHGFGAASGYSMINDGIKTIDDAINEATIDMRNNKEELMK